MPVRICWLSNAPYAPSGYGTQTFTWSRKLRELGHEVIVAAFHGLQSAPLHHDGVTILPAADDQYGRDIVLSHYQACNADLLITLMDAWVLTPASMAGMNVAHWMPVDCDPVSAMDRVILDGAGGQPVAMSRFGERVLTEAGYEPLYVPHGIDCQVFRPLEDRAAARAELGMDDRFVVAIAAANADPIRKGFAEQFAAFAAFRRKRRDALLLVHARVKSQLGVDLSLLAENLGIADAVKFGDQYQIVSGMVTQAELAKWYGLADVLLHCSYGEGFGLASVEAQACGTPVITSGFSAMGELAGPGWKISHDQDDMFWNRGHSSWWVRPRPSRIRSALEKAYSGAAGLRGQARAFAVGYDADRVLTQHWKPVLESIEAGL